MRFSSATLLLGLVARAVSVGVLASVDSAYLCPWNPFQPLLSTAKSRPVTRGSSKHGTKVKVTPGRRVVVAEPAWKYEDFEEEEEEEETNFKGKFWEVRTSPGKGLGLFARRKIKRGTRILIEPPLFTVRLEAGGAQQLLADVERAVQRLGPRDKGAYLSCFDNRPADDKDSSRELLIFRNNATPLSASDGTSSSFGIFPKAAKINHSCRPNAVSTYADTRGARVVWAARTIKRDEEITVTYVPLLQDTETRREGLAKFGFHCECEVCRTEDNNSKKKKKKNGKNGIDERRIEMGNLLVGLEQQLVSQKPPAEDVLQRAERLVGMLEEEGLADYLGKAYHLAAFAAVRMDDPVAARRWGEKELELHGFADDDSQFARAARQFLEKLPATD